MTICQALTDREFGVIMFSLTSYTTRDSQKMPVYASHRNKIGSMHGHNLNPSMFITKLPVSWVVE